MNAAETIAAYYAALRAGEPLGPLSPMTQTARWHVESPTRPGPTPLNGTAGPDRDDGRLDCREPCAPGDRTRGLRVVQRRRDTCWTGTEGAVRHEYDTRWSGALEATGGEREWQFVGMHVSTADELGE